MKKVFLVLAMLIATSANAWNVSDLNDNEQMALDCYGDHDMKVYFINENGVEEQYRQFAYIEAYKEDDKE